MIAPVHTRTPAATAALSAIEAARSNRSALRIQGAGTWLEAGRPVATATPLSLQGARGIVEYIPGDLTMTVGAATTLGEIATATSAERQWLALDPAGSDHGTIGATVSTNSSGPLAHAFGAPRDQVLGLEFVTGAGTVVRGGGRVVKNVAGFDLTRLVVGSWGTLGVITEISLRLRALPEVDTTVALPLPADSTQLVAVIARMAEARLAAFALEMVNDALAQRLDLGNQSLLLVRLGGNAELVKAQQKVLSELGDLQPDVDARVWTHIRGADSEASTVLRVSQRRSLWADTWTRAVAIAKPAGGVLHGSAGRGVARIALRGNTAQLAHSLRSELDRFDGTVIFERLPAPLWQELARPSAMDPLSRGVKRTFDPDNVLNPGILGEPST